MAFIFTCGTHTFSSILKGYENITAQCQNCGNFSARVYKRWEWFTFCFIPVIPFSLKPDKDVGCHICKFYQDLRHRPDVQNMMEGGGGGQPIPMQGGPQGWNNQGQHPQQQPQYAQGGQPQYK
ncbi:hypothetical protein Q7P35_005659 [Cladosporium inversicolor]